MDRALAAAAYMATPKVRPTTNYPLELHYIRALFIQQNHRQCIHACRDVLRASKDDFASRPLQKTFVLFYLALAHDELARVMHPTSQTKLPAFNSAEHYFLEAVRALPTIEQARVHYAQSFQKDADVSSDRSVSKSLSDTTSFHEVQSWEVDSLSSGHRSGQHNLSSSSDNLVHSDFDDLESHSGFQEILASGDDHQLQRDFSRVSLLDGPGPHKGPQSHGLMRPIRLGSPPKPYIAPPSRKTGITIDTTNLRPRRGVRRVYTDKSALQVPFVPVDSGSPVSPLDPGEHHSDTSTISPVSPETPPHASSLPGPPPPSFHISDDLFATRLDPHLGAIRIQLENHIALVQEAKQQLFRSRANRLSTMQPPRRPPSANSNSSTMSKTKKHRSASPIRTAWSIADEDALRAEKKRRVEDGRERKWARQRFQSERYQDLANRALTEL